MKEWLEGLYELQGRILYHTKLEYAEFSFYLDTQS
jgi:hypothetical protein